MQEKAKEPEIRFAGFTGAWEQRKFGEMANRRSEVSASGNLPRVEYEDIVSGTGTLNKDVFEKQSQKQGIVFHSGDVLYGKLRPYLQNWLLASFNGLAVGDFWVLEPQGLNSNYLYRIIQTKQFDEIANQSVGTKMPRADWKLVSKATFLNPASFNEQRLIGKFFKDIDSLLTLHQRKYEKLLNIKKSMLEKMFPKEGEVAPEIRFKGFTGAWEQRKLSDGMTEYTDRVFIEDDQIYRQVTVKNTGEISLRGSQPGRNIGRKRQARVNLRDYPMTLIFTRQTVEQGGIGFAKNDVDGCIVTENMPTIAVDGKKFNQDFLVAFFKTYGFRKDVILSNIEGGTAQIAIHEDDILDSSSTFPSLKEQIKIGNFFRTLSQQITLHQRKLEMLKNVKQAFLEKMFV